MVNELEQNAGRIEALGRSLGLDYYPVDFEIAPQSLMTEIAVYGLPVRMPHWSFGVRYIHQLVRQSMGHSKIFEVMQKRFDPSRTNLYFFYASDGENAAEDRDDARATLAELAGLVNYAGYVETGGIASFRPRETQLAEIFGELKGGGGPVGVSHLGSQEDVWRAIREFFTEQAAHE